MASDDKTVFDPGATAPESDKTEIHVSDLTIPSSDETVPEDEHARLASDETVPEGEHARFASDVTVLEGGDSVQSRSVAVYEKGSMILETYRVEDDAIEAGGMGRVWRVHHTGWNTDLAMKQQRGEYFATEKQKADFTRECETWINLGLHPSIVSCYYVREIDSIPQSSLNGWTAAAWLM